MDDLSKTSLLFPWWMLCGTLVAVYLSNAKLLNWDSVAETNDFAICLLACYAVGVLSTCFNWIASKQFKISTLHLIGLTTFVSALIAVPTIAIIAGLIFMFLDDRSRTQDRKRKKQTLQFIQRFAMCCGGVYATAASIQQMTGIAG